MWQRLCRMDANRPYTFTCYTQDVSAQSEFDGTLLSDLGKSLHLPAASRSYNHPRKAAGLESDNEPEGIPQRVLRGLQNRDRTLPILSGRQKPAAWKVPEMRPEGPAERRRAPERRPSILQRMRPHAPSSPFALRRPFREALFRRRASAFHRDRARHGCHPAARTTVGSRERSSVFGVLALTPGGRLDEGQRRK